MKAIDWSGIYKKYKGKWVALADDEKTVLADGKSLKEAAQKAEKKGFTNPIFMRVPSKSAYYVGAFR